MIRRWSWTFVLAGVALVVRGLQARGALLYPDGYQYLLMAKGIAAHGRPVVKLGPTGETWLPSADASLKPLFPALVALVHLLGPSLTAAARALTAVSAAAVCVLAGLVAERLTGSAVAGASTGALALASPTLGHWAGFSQPDPLAQALALGAALALLHRRPLVAGAIAGLCVVTRPEYVLLVLPACFLSARFMLAAATAASSVIASVRPPLAFHSALAAPAAAVPGGLTGVARSDWPLLALAVAGLAAAPRRHALALGGGALALAVAYTLKNPGSARYFAELVPIGCVTAGYAVTRASPRALLVAAAVGLAVFLPRPAPPPPNSFDAIAAHLRGTTPLYTAAPDAYGLLLSRPVRSLRSGVHGLVLVDPVLRAYEPSLRVRGRLVRTILPPVGFVRPDGTIDGGAIRLVRGSVAD